MGARARGRRAGNGDAGEATTGTRAADDGTAGRGRGEGRGGARTRRANANAGSDGEGTKRRGERCGDITPNGRIGR